LLPADVLLDGIRGPDCFCCGSFLDGLDLVLGELILCLDLRSPSLEIAFGDSQAVGFRFWHDIIVHRLRHKGWVAITEAHIAHVVLVLSGIGSGSLVHDVVITEQKVGPILAIVHVKVPIQACLPAPQCQCYKLEN